MIFAGDLPKLSRNQQRLVRGRGRDGVPDPMTPLNPVLTVAARSLRRLLHLAWITSRRVPVPLNCLMVGILSARERLDDYPHHFRAACASAMIAMGIRATCNSRS